MIIGAAMGGTWQVPTNWKNCVEKHWYFWMLYFIVSTFPKIVKNSIFLLNFQQTFIKISTKLDFSSKCAKDQLRVFKSFFNQQGITMHFCNFLKKTFTNFLKFSSVRGATPQHPLRSVPPKVFPMSRNPGGAAAYCADLVLTFLTTVVNTITYTTITDKLNIK